jgi:hypothetical protein
MLGTFSEEEDKALPEPDKLNPQSYPEVKIGNERWQWRPVKARANGALEIRRSQPSPNSAYAFTKFDWPRAENIVLYVGSENGLRIWLNGKAVYDAQAKRSYVPDTDAVDVTVVQGTNTLLLRVFDEGPIWRTSIRPGPKNLYPPPAVQLYLGDGKGRFTEATHRAGDLAQLRADSVSASWADIDNDGLQDLIVISKTGLVRYYHNLGEGKFRYATAEIGLDQRFKASGALAADFNRDGRLDLVLLGNDPDPCVILLSKMKGKLTPVTVRPSGDKSAIDARVAVETAEGRPVAMHIISGGAGRNLQSTPEARFAVAPGRYRVVLRYSSGASHRHDIVVEDRPLWLDLGNRP